MTTVGSPLYMAPEVMTTRKYSEKADIYSFAIVFWELCTCRTPYTGSEFTHVNVANLLHLISEGMRPDTKKLPPAISNILTQCWAANEADRPSGAQVVKELQKLKHLKLEIRETTEDERKIQTV